MLLTHTPISLLNWPPELNKYSKLQKLYKLSRSSKHSVVIIDVNIPKYKI